MNWLRTLLLVLALMHLVFGIYGLYQPLQMAQLSELEAPTASARSEIRAIYGGLMIAIGVVVGWGALGGPVGAAWLRAVAIAYAGLFFGRVVSVSVDGPTGYTLFAGAFEIALAGFFVWAASQLRAARRAVEPAGNGDAPPTQTSSAAPAPSPPSKPDSPRGG